MLTKDSFSPIMNYYITFENLTISAARALLAPPGDTYLNFPNIQVKQMEGIWF